MLWGLRWGQAPWPKIPGLRAQKRVLQFQSPNKSCWLRENETFLLKGCKVSRMRMTSRMKAVTLPKLQAEGFDHLLSPVSESYQYLEPRVCGRTVYEFCTSVLLWIWTIIVSTFVVRSSTLQRYCICYRASYRGYRLYCPWSSNLAYLIDWLWLIDIFPHSREQHLPKPRGLDHMTRRVPLQLQPYLASAQPTGTPFSYRTYCQHSSWSCRVAGAGSFCLLASVLNSWNLETCQDSLDLAQLSTQQVPSAKHVATLFSFPFYFILFESGSAVATCFDFASERLSPNAFSMWKHRFEIHFCWLSTFWFQHVCHGALSCVCVATPCHFNPFQNIWSLNSSESILRWHKHGVLSQP